MRKSDFSSFRFAHGGLCSAKGAYRHSTRKGILPELIIVTRGILHMQENNVCYDLQPGDYLLLAPNQLHGGTAISETPPEFYWLHWHCAETGIFSFPPNFHMLPTSARLTDPSTMVQLVRQLLHCQDTATYPAETCNHLLYVIFSELVSQMNCPGIQSTLAIALHDYIRSNSDRLLTVAEIAAQFGYHPDYLSRVMRKNYGRTLHQDIDTERLSRAQLLLQTSDFTVAQIAAELGYEDTNLFAKFFRYHTNTTPSSYRSSFRIAPSP